MRLCKRCELFNRDIGCVVSGRSLGQSRPRNVYRRTVTDWRVLRNGSVAIAASVLPFPPHPYSPCPAAPGWQTSSPSWPSSSWPASARPCTPATGGPFRVRARGGIGWAKRRGREGSTLHLALHRLSSGPGGDGGRGGCVWTPGPADRPDAPGQVQACGHTATVALTPAEPNRLVGTLSAPLAAGALLAFNGAMGDGHRVTARYVVE